MYVIERLLLGKNNPGFKLKWLICCISDKSYHSENGVYGYKPSQRRHFEGICLIEGLKIVEFNFFVIKVWIYLIPFTHDIKIDVIRLRRKKIKNKFYISAIILN